MSEPAVNPLENALILQINFKQLGNNRQIDTDYVDTTADKNWLRTSKMLLKSEYLVKLSNFAEKVRRTAARKGQPFPLQASHYLIPHNRLNTVISELAEARDGWNALVDAFKEEYPHLKSQAQVDLGNLYNPADYPAEEELDRYFSFSWAIVQESVPSELGKISEALLLDEQRKAAEKIESMAHTVRLAIRKEFMTIVDSTREQLTGTREDGKPKTFTVLTMNRVLKWVNDLKTGGDLTNDDDLRRLAIDLERTLMGFEAADIRSDEGLKKYIGATCASVQEELADLMIDKPRRKFNLE